MKPSEFSLWRRKYSILKYRRRIQFKWQMESKQRHRYQNENLARAPKGAKKCQLNPYKMDIAWNYSTKLSTTNAPAAKAVFRLFSIKFKLILLNIFHVSSFFAAMHCSMKCLQVPFNIAHFFHKSHWKLKPEKMNGAQFQVIFFSKKSNFSKILKLHVNRNSSNSCVVIKVQITEFLSKYFEWKKSRDILAFDCLETNSHSPNWPLSNSIYQFHFNFVLNKEL